eukprot:6199139-Pleurochrysis_carterae.AAC.1
MGDALPAVLPESDFRMQYKSFCKLEEAQIEASVTAGSTGQVSLQRPESVPARVVTSHLQSITYAM